MIFLLVSYLHYNEINTITNKLLALVSQSVILSLFAYRVYYTSVARCPTIFLRLPQLWRINKAICHIFAKPSLVTNMPKFFLYFHILSHLFSQYFVVSKCELNEKISILVLFCQNQPNFEVFGNKAIRHI